jgi:CHAT domain-containing protein
VLWDDSIDYVPVKSDLANSSLDARPAINSYCLVLTEGGVSSVRLDPGFDYLGAVNELRRLIIDGREVSALEECRNGLYAALIKPVLGHIPPGVTDLVIVPDGSLMYLPWDILREAGTAPDLGETYRLSLSPSVSVSVLAVKTGEAVREPLLAFGGAWYDRNRTAAERGKRLLVVLEGKTDKTGETDKTGVREIRWLDLPGTEEEVKKLQDLKFDASPTVFLGGEVSEARVKELSLSGALKGYPVIHFACHGYFDEGEPSWSSIIFSEVSGLVETGEDGFLTIPEIAVLDLDSRMVVLSACETGLGQVKRGDGMVGLTRSFLVAGAGNVGVSLWSISDDATVEFMTAVYRKVIEGGVSFGEAYYRTKGEFRRRTDLWSHPLYWAAFTLYE